MTGRHVAGAPGPKASECSFALLVAACIVLAGQCARAESLTLHPVADTFLSQAYPDNNFGAIAYFNSGTTQNGTTNRGLIKFDLAGSLPPDAQILSATLTLEVVGVPNEDFPAARFNLHRLLRPWGEGRGTNTIGGGAGQGSAATTNEAIWSHRFAYTSDTWSQSGGAAPADFMAEGSSGVTVGGTDQSPYEIPGTARMIADLQLWLDDPATNHGWLLHCQQEATRFTARRFGSREDEFNAPRLEVNFLVRPRLLLADKIGKRLRFHFTARAGQSYRVEFHDFATPGQWQVLTNYGWFGSPEVVTCADLLTSTQRFYRVVAE